MKMFSPTLHYAEIANPFGRVLLVTQDHGLAGCYFIGQKYMPAIAAGWRHTPAHPLLRLAATQLERYAAGTLQQFELPFAFAEGTDFQQRVWRAIAAIPYGETITYGELARRVGAPGSARAAGAATGRNPISVIVPCHRVIGSNGSLTGYAGGIERKKALLALEGAREAQIELSYR